MPQQNQSRRYYVAIVCSNSSALPSKTILDLANRYNCGPLHGTVNFGNENVLIIGNSYESGNPEIPLPPDTYSKYKNVHVYVFLQGPDRRAQSIGQLPFTLPGKELPHQRQARLQTIVQEIRELRDAAANIVIYIDQAELMLTSERNQLTGFRNELINVNNELQNAASDLNKAFTERQDINEVKMKIQALNDRVKAAYTGQMKQIHENINKIIEYLEKLEDFMEHIIQQDTQIDTHYIQQAIITLRQFISHYEQIDHFTRQHKFLGLNLRRDEWERLLKEFFDDLAQIQEDANKTANINRVYQKLVADFTNTRNIMDQIISLVQSMSQGIPLSRQDAVNAKYAAQMELNRLQGNQPVQQPHP
ncbi:hypothetical protein JXB41_05210 [Candidatus Woesearchaeota archaeon]|nr:hypothetical protein [Candidatus Woesearchaeota archaeon]